MFALGHLGFGLELAKPFDRGLPRKSILLGTVLPDLIDKPLYYGLSWATGRHGAALGMIAGTRSLGHTVLFTASLAALGAVRRSKVLLALALGCATHLVLDMITDLCVRRADFSMRAFAWPLLGWQFPVYGYSGLGDHLRHIREPFLLYSELIGALVLFWEWRRSRESLPR